VTVLGTTVGDAERLGVHRSLEPPGALPHIARRLDAALPANAYEAELAAEMLAIDATSFADIRRRSGGDPEAMADLIRSIVAEHGKHQNPVTGSGGVVLGRVTSVGADRVLDDLTPGELVVPLASLIAVPLELHEVGPVDPASPLVPVRGRAIVTGAMLCGRVAADLGATVSLTAFDVYPVASYARELALPGGHVLVLGAGHAGLLAVAAARLAVGSEGTVTAVDVRAAALERAREVDPAAITVRADVTDPLGLAEQTAGPADLTLVCTSVPGAEGAALVATATRGTIVFFSTATRFAAAALGADAVGSQAKLVIPNGLTDDRGEFALELLRTVAPLRVAFGGQA
jgi:L-erythro-3,5-diaminohexanoate dehydrogenase